MYRDESSFILYKLVVYSRSKKHHNRELLQNKSSAVAEMGNRLATIDMGRKGEAAVPLSGGGSLAPPNNVTWAEIYLRTKWHLDPSSHLATTDMGRKLGAAVHLFLGGAGSPCNTMWPGPKATPVPSGILIHAVVWPQYMGQTWGCCAPFFGGE